MPGHELRMGNAIAVGENQVVGRCFGNGAIEDLALAKARVLVPDVANVERPLRACPFDALARFFAGSVVRDDDFELAYVCRA